MSAFQILAVLLTVAAIGGYINHRFIRLPETIGHMAFSLVVSLVVVALARLSVIDLQPVQAVLQQIDFTNVLLHGMLSFLLFAGALHINLSDLKTVRVPVTVLATVGVVVSTFITGTLIWYLAHWVGVPLLYIYALLFGALISPTDPIAVLSILKHAGASRKLYVKVGGESLFNDGIGVVVFLSIFGVATGSASPTVGSVAASLLREALGGATLGLLLGWIVYRLLRSINDHKVELLLTLALVTGGYALAEAQHLSAPICMVVAGLLIGSHGRLHGMSAATRERLDGFWELLDEILNAVLFMLIGFEVIVVSMSWSHAVLGLAAVVAVLFARFVSVGAPVLLLRPFYPFEKGTVPLLTWGGLRGGISIALALSLPVGEEKDIILPVTYLVVIFSILVQGLTFERLVRLLK